MQPLRNRKMRRAGLYAEAGVASFHPAGEQEALLRALQRAHNHIVPTEAEARALALEEYRLRADARRRQIEGGRSAPLDYVLTRPLDVRLPGELDEAFEAAARQAVDLALNRFGRREDEQQETT